MVPLVIPTRNRPMSLSFLLKYLGEFNPGQRVVIANGSHHSYLAAYEEAVRDNDSLLQIEYKEYDSDLHFRDRMVDCVSGLDDDIIFVGADDDFPVLDTLYQGVEFLRANHDHVVAIGGIICLSMLDEDQFNAKFLHAFSLQDEDIVSRLSKYSQWAFATSYAATRRDHYLERCNNLQLNAMKIFGDYNVGLHDCLAGKIKALPEIGYFTTKLATHSRFGPPSRLHYLEHAQETLNLRDYYAEKIASTTAIDNQEARSIADKLIAMKIAHWTGGSPQFLDGFGCSSLFRDEIVRKQYDAFQDLFRQGTAEQKKLGGNLRKVVDAMLEISEANSDNHGEPEKYDSIEYFLASTNGGISRP